MQLSSAYHIFIINYRLFSSYYHLDEFIIIDKRKTILLVKRLLSCLGFLRFSQTEKKVKQGNVLFANLTATSMMSIF